MTQPDTHPFTETNIAMLKRLAGCGGSMRIATLARDTSATVDELCHTLNTLAQLRWLRIVWRRRPQGTPPARLARVDRVTLTRLGRARLPVKCVLLPPRLSRRRRHPRPGP